MKAKSHKDLDVWKLSMDFIKDLYEITNRFPGSEKFCLVQQIRRAGISISSNIAEGSARNYSKEKIQFLYFSLGSLSEVDTQLEIALRLGYVKDIQDQRIKMYRLRHMLLGLIKSLKDRLSERT